MGKSSEKRVGRLARGGSWFFTRGCGFFGNYVRNNGRLQKQVTKLRNVTKKCNRIFSAVAGDLAEGYKVTIFFKKVYKKKRGKESSLLYNIHDNYIYKVSIFS